MKNLIFIILLFASSCVLSQELYYKNFNSDVMNKVLEHEINKFRRSRGLDTLVHSDVVFNQISKVNCKQVADSGRLYHPNFAPKWNNTIKRPIAEEAERKIGGKVVLINDGDTYYVNMAENAFRTNQIFATYQGIAKHAIECWEASTKGHKEAQNRVYASGGLPGVFACHCIRGKDGFIYIFINYVEIVRDYPSK
jgi:hypothetical protein